MHPKKTFFSLALGVFFLTGSFVMIPVVAAETTFPATLSCLSETGTKGTSFSLMAGERAVFTCTAQTKGTGKAYGALLLGSQALGTETLVTSSSDLALTDTATTTLTFPPTFQSGTYRYTFSLIDTATKLPLARELVLSGILKGTGQPPIQAVTLKQKTALWGEPFTLNLTLQFPEGTNLKMEAYTLHVALQGAQGGECAVLTESAPVTSETLTLDLFLPQKAECANAVTVMLRDKTGFIVDQRALTVELPEKVAEQFNMQPLGASETFFGTPSIAIKVGLTLTSIFLLALIGYFLIKRNRRS